MLRPTIRPATIAELLESPTAVNMEGNLVIGFQVSDKQQRFRRFVSTNSGHLCITYQNGPRNPMICLNKDTKTPTLAAFSAAQSTA